MRWRRCAAAFGYRKRGLGGKAILLMNGEFRAETTRCSKCDHLLHDGSARLDFMTDDVSEAEEMRIQTLASDCVAELRNSNESGWVAVRGGCWQTRPLEVPIAEALAGTHFPWPQDQVIRLHGADRVAVLGLSGVMEQRKQLSVVTDGSVGVYGPTIVLGSPTTASGEGRHTIRAILTLQISRP